MTKKIEQDAHPRKLLGANTINKNPAGADAAYCRFRSDGSFQEYRSLPAVCGCVIAKINLEPVLVCCAHSQGRRLGSDNAAGNIGHHAAVLIAIVLCNSSEADGSRGLFGPVDPFIRVLLLVLPTVLQILAIGADAERRILAGANSDRLGLTGNRNDIGNRQSRSIGSNRACSVGHDAAVLIAVVLFKTLEADAVVLPDQLYQVDELAFLYCHW